MTHGRIVYAETLADEGGLYTDDPLGRIGYLQSMLLRAARLVADTGIQSLTKKAVIEVRSKLEAHPDLHRRTPWFFEN